MGKRWFMSYAQVYARGGFSFGHNVYEGDEHPIEKASRWSASYGAQNGFRIVVLSFQEVGPDVPECDVLSNATGGK